MPLELGGDFGNYYGNLGWLAGGAGALWTAGHVTGDTNMTGAARDAVVGLAVDGALVVAIKRSVDRRRPNGGRWSFPSGHTSSAFTIAPILQSRFGWKVGVPAYALAFATGFGRIEDGWHHPSDVVAGATLGLLIGQTIAHRGARPGAGLLDHLVVHGRNVGVAVEF
jgi:membrane-associated phospholipid phosphatase